MDQALAVKDQLLQALRHLVQSVVDGAPKVIVGIVLVILAIIVAKLIERILRVVLRRIRFDALLEKTGIKATLARIGITQTGDQTIPRIAYYLLLFLFAQTAAEALGLTPISQAIGSFFGYLPNLLAALALVLIGSVAGQFAGKTVARAAKESGIDYASALGSIVSALILVIAGIMAIGQLKIDTEIVRIVTTCALAGIALAFGLSFCLGSREITRNIIAGFYARKVFRVGEEMEIAGEKAVLRSITPVQAVLDKEGQTITVSNSVFIEQVVKQ